MLENADEPGVPQRLEELASAIPSGASLVEAVCDHSDPFQLLPGTKGFDFAALTPVEGRPNRAVFKLFKIEDGPMEKTDAVFFYKTSQLPFSHDRFSYGVCLAPRQRSPNSAYQEWLRYATCGFDPTFTPKNLRRAFTFTVPD